MRGNPESVAARNICVLSAVLILISCFIGCTAGSCLSYGHSCWGAHGKRSGYPQAAGVPSRRVAGPPPIPDDRLLLSRLVSRRSPLAQAVLAARLRARLQQEAEEQPRLLVLPVPDDELERSMAAERLSRDFGLRGVATGEERMTEAGSSDILFNSQHKDLGIDDDQAIKLGLYKILKNLDEESK